MPPPAAEPDVNNLAARALDLVGAQREMPALSATHGWSLLSWGFGHGRWLADALPAALLLLCLGFIAAAILRARARRSDPWAEAVPVAAGPGGAASPHLDLAEAHARDGHFAEAIHELLLQALADIRGRPGTSLAPSLTSREILRQARLGEPCSTTLRMLIGRVEYIYFGLRAADGNDYRTCRGDLDQLRQALGPA